MKKYFSLIILAIVLLVSVAININDKIKDSFSPNPPKDSELFAAYKNKRSNLQVKGEGVIIKILKDDIEGIRHQRFLLRLGSAQTVLITHNIDLAPRIPNPKVGEVLMFYGVYEWNNKGGIIHWIHHDPKGKRPDGWLSYQGKVYQ